MSAGGGMSQVCIMGKIKLKDSCGFNIREGKSKVKPTLKQHVLKAVLRNLALENWPKQMKNYWHIHFFVYFPKTLWAL